MRFIFYQQCLLLVWVFMLAGCASHADKMQTAKDLLAYEEYAAAEAEISSQLSSDRNRLLKLMELGVLHQLQGDYLSSLQHLEAADRLAEELYTVSFADLALRATTNATLTIYRGNLVERVYINYFKMLNYFYLAEAASSRQERQRLLDSARVEARRSLVLLDENVYQTGTYAEAEQENSALASLLKAFSALNGSVIQPEQLIFRDNAFSHYLIGSLFEVLGELDSARVSYERAARLYEEGYAKQYGLDPQISSQAWLATARILKTQGDNRWRRVAEQKLSAQQRTELEQFKAEFGQLLVLQEVDMVAPRGELNLWVVIQNNRLIIRPVLVGTDKEKAYQLAWFYYLYADKGLLGVVERLHAEDYLGLLTSSVEKILPLPGALRSVLENLGLWDAMTSTGLRLSVPLLYYYEQPVQASRIEINGNQSQSLVLADNLSGLAMAQHLVDAQRELTQAMAIEALRLATCVNAGAPPALCALALASTTSADTRSWLTLPYEIRLLSTWLPAGAHAVKLVSQFNNQVLEQEQSVNLQAGQLSLVRWRTFAVDPHAPIPAVVKKARTVN